MSTEFVTIRDDITVLTAIRVRQENTLQAVLDQLRTMTTQRHRFGDRLSQLEESWLEEMIEQPS